MLLGVGALTVPSVARAQACVGDCNGDTQVTVDEIVTMVNIALGQANVSACQAGDPSGDGAVTVDEILQAVNNALNGCPPVGGCTSALLTVSLDFPESLPLGGVTVEVNYPTASVAIPGSGNEQTVLDRVMDITGIGGFFSPFDLDTNSDSIDDQVRTGAVVTPSQFTPGGFELITFGCLGASDPVVGDFSCAVADASDTFGNPVDGVGCSLGLMTE
jgi:hypothetical protein